MGGTWKRPLAKVKRRVETPDERDDAVRDWPSIGQVAWQELSKCGTIRSDPPATWPTLATEGANDMGDERQGCAKRVYGSDVIFGGEPCARAGKYEENGMGALNATIEQAAGEAS